jgi:hypothetical protein
MKMLSKILIELRDAEEDYDEVYQKESRFRDNYAYKLITRAQNRVFEARNTLYQYSVLHRIAVQKDIPHSTIELIMGYL